MSDFDDGESKMLWVHRSNYQKDMKNQFIYGLAAGAGVILLLLAVFVFSV